MKNKSKLSADGRVGKIPVFEDKKEKLKFINSLAKTCTTFMDSLHEKGNDNMFDDMVDMVKIIAYIDRMMLFVMYDTYLAKNYGGQVGEKEHFDEYCTQMILNIIPGMCAVVSADVAKEMSQSMIAARKGAMSMEDRKAVTETLLAAFAEVISFADGEKKDGEK